MEATDTCIIESGATQWVEAGCIWAAESSTAGVELARDSGGETPSFATEMGSRKTCAGASTTTWGSRPWAAEEGSSVATWMEIGWTELGMVLGNEVDLHPTWRGETSCGVVGRGLIVS